MDAYSLESPPPAPRVALGPALRRRHVTVNMGNNAETFATAEEAADDNVVALITWRQWAVERATMYGRWQRAWERRATAFVRAGPRRWFAALWWLLVTYLLCGARDWLSLRLWRAREYVAERTLLSLRAQRARAALGAAVTALWDYSGYLVALGICVALYAAYTADPRAVYVAHLGLVRDGDPGVRFNESAVSVTCAMLRNERRDLDPSIGGSSLAALRDRANLLLQSGARDCVCAPMFGVRVRLLSVRGDAGDMPMHLYNATLSAEDTERIRNVVSGDPVTRGYWLTEDDSPLFPTRRAPNRRFRLSAITVDALLDAACKSERVLLADAQRAECAQYCLDLMNGAL